MTVPILHDNGGLYRSLEVELPKNHYLFLHAAAHEMGQGPTEVAETILIGTLTEWANQAMLVEMLMRAVLPMPAPTVRT